MSKEYNVSIVIVISLSKSHMHYVKGLIASINYYHPNNQIIVIKDGDFNSNSLLKYDQVAVVDNVTLNSLHDLDLNILLTKLNLFFLRKLGYEYDYYLHMDADSILTNPINFNYIFESKADFYILQGEIINYNETRFEKLMNNFAFNPDDFPEYTFDKSKMFFFSSGHIIINNKIINALIKSLEIHRFEINKRRLKNKRIKFNDQGFLNLAINILFSIGNAKVIVISDGIYGRDIPENFPELNIDNVKSKNDTGVLFIHYTGPSRKVNIKAHNFGGILEFFIKLFYKNQFIYSIDQQKRKIIYYYKWLTIRVKLKLKSIFFNN